MKVDFIRIEFLKGLKQATDYEKTYTNHVSDQGFLSRLHK